MRENGKVRVLADKTVESYAEAESVKGVRATAQHSVGSGRSDFRVARASRSLAAAISCSFQPASESIETLRSLHRYRLGLGCTGHIV